MNYHLNIDNETPAVDQNLYYEKCNLFSDVESQTNFVKDFLDNTKIINKDIRKIINQKIKQNTVKNTRKNKQKSNSFVQDIVSLANNNQNQNTIETSILQIDQQKYLIDQLLNVYHFNNHNLIGHFNPNNQSIIFI